MGLHATDTAIRPDDEDAQVGGQTVKWATDVRTYSPGQQSRCVYFNTLDDDDLREFAKRFGPGRWNEWSRAQILALLNNRCPDGYVVEIEDTGDDFHPATRALQAVREAQAR
jgi:hypothetical protein